MRDWLHPRDEIMQTMERIYRYRMTTTSGGNLSIRDGQGDVWITPARVDKGSLRREDIIRVGADGQVDGPHPPSSEFPFHQAIYAARPDLRAVLHAHPVALVAFSICGAVPDTRLFHQAHYVCGGVGFAPYGLPGSAALGERIADTFAAVAAPNCVVMENHGVVIGGASLSQAFQRFEALEFAAKTVIKARHLGEVRYLDERQLQAAQQRCSRCEVLPHLPDVTSEEQELRRQLREFIRRGCRQRLLISTEGSFSARLNERDFLITPSQRDRASLEVGDFVRVCDGRCPAGANPSRATLAHQAIYRQHPDVRAIVFAHPVNATAFSVTRAPLDVRTIPESYVFLRDVQRIPYGLQYQQFERLAEYISPPTPAALLENDGVVVTGRSVLDAFDRLEVLESTAEAIINARSIGPIREMSDKVIAELRQAFQLP